MLNSNKQKCGWLQHFAIWHIYMEMWCGSSWCRGNGESIIYYVGCWLLTSSCIWIYVQCTPFVLGLRGHYRTLPHVCEWIYMQANSTSILGYLLAICQLSIAIVRRHRARHNLSMAHPTTMFTFACCRVIYNGHNGDTQWVSRWS